MHTLQGTILRVVGWCGVFGAVFVAGCSGDDTSPGTQTPEDASADHTTGTFQDASQLDAGVDGSSHDGSVEDGSIDAAPDGSSDAQGSAADSGSDATSVTDAPGEPDRADASEPVDANEAGGVCVTTIANLGGASPVDAGVMPTVLVDFDAVDAGLDPNFTDFTNAAADAGSSETMSETSADGYPCPGALSLSVTYTSYGTTDGVYYNYKSAQDWTGYTKLHAWLKVVTSGYTTINGVQPRVDSNGYTDNLFGGFVNGSTFAGGGWRETTVDLTGTNYVPATVNGFQFELQTTSAAAGGGPTTPPPATLLVDSIWIE